MSDEPQNEAPKPTEPAPTVSTSASKKTTGEPSPTVSKAASKKSTDSKKGKSSVEIVTPDEEKKDEELCDLPDKDCVPSCRCEHSGHPHSMSHCVALSKAEVSCNQTQEKLEKKPEANKGDFQNPSIESRTAFYKADEECCYNCNYCPFVIVKRYINDKARYARHQYPLTTTYKSDYRPFKPSLPENDVKIMAMIRNWGSGPDFLHHPHLDSVSSPDPEILYLETYKKFDCCGDKHTVPQQQHAGRRNLSAGDCGFISQSDFCSIVHPGHQRKFTLLGDNPLPHSSNHHCKPTWRNDTLQHQQNVQTQQQRYIGHPSEYSFQYRDYH